MQKIIINCCLCNVEYVVTCLSLVVICFLMNGVIHDFMKLLVRLDVSTQTPSNYSKSKEIIIIFPPGLIYFILRLSFNPCYPYLLNYLIKSTLFRLACAWHSFTKDCLNILTDWDLIFAKYRFCFYTLFAFFPSIPHTE